jgi:hypothetical protein
VTQPDFRPLPDDAILLHIGPHKTGTTALQGAFHANREALAEHHVHYAGAGRQPMLAALAMTGRPGRRGDRRAKPRHWQRLLNDVSSAGDSRVVVSSEFFTDSSDDVARDIVTDLGQDRVHVVVTLRPLHKIMPSQWQQYVQNGLRTRYPMWLDHMLNKPPYEKPTPTFWRRHSHGDLVRRWADVVGPDHLTVIVLDESNRRMLLDTFEALLALPSGVLQPEEGLTNRSLTAGEIEVIRRINEEFKARNWPDSMYGAIARNGIAKQLLVRQPSRDEPTILTPTWALEGAAKRGAAAVASIEATGVRVIGDLASMSAIPDPAPGADEPPSKDAELPASAATIAILGTLYASRGVSWPKTDDADTPAIPQADEERTLDGFRSGTMLRVIAARARRRLLRTGSRTGRQRRKAKANAQEKAKARRSRPQT